MIRKNKDVGLYLAKFLGLFFLLFYGTEAVIALSSPGGYYNPWIAQYLNFIDPFRQLLLKAVQWLLRTLGFQTYFKDSFTLSFVNGRGVRMVYSCLGYGVMSFWIAFVVANRGGWKRKMIWMLGGCLVLCGLNILRIGLVLVATNKHWPVPLGWDHHTWFNIIAYLFIFVMMYGYDSLGKKAGVHKNGREPVGWPGESAERSELYR